MNSEWASAYAEWASALGTWVASVVVIISVFILRAQLQDTRRTIRSASVQGAYNLWVSIDQFFISHPELRPFIYDGKPLDKSVNKTLRKKVECAAEMMLDAMANIHHQLPNLTPEEAEAYGNFLKERYRTQPVLKQFVDQHGHWYPNSFTGFLRSKQEWINNKPPTLRR
jgi:hypothetical protein